jgi:dynein heavy chain 1
MQTVEIKAEKLLLALPKQIDGLEKHESPTSEKNPIFRFLKREVSAATKLLKHVRTDLANLIDMCAGKIKTTNDIRDIARSLLIETVPQSWKIYITELGVTQWVIDLKNRILQLNKLIKSNDFGKSDIWLGGLIYPEAFLTATRQYVAQCIKVPLDELQLTLNLPSSIKEQDLEENDFVVSGLSLEGAEWNYDNKKLNMTDNLSEQLNKSILRWNIKTKDSSNHAFHIPVYLTSMRKQLLFSVLIKNESDLSDNDWYQRGISLISWNKRYEYKAE